MPHSNSLESTLATEYSRLSTRLREAADYIAANPVNVATRSLRSLSAASGLAPATFSRLARALGYDSYEGLREQSRHSVGRRMHSFSEKVGRLQAEADGGARQPFLVRQARACAANIETMTDRIDPETLRHAVDRLHDARKVMLVGALGSTGLVEYLAYMANFVTDNWFVAGHAGASLASGLTGLDASDALLVVTKPPFARSAIRAAELGAGQGAFVLVISDTLACPALKFADAGFVVPTQSPQFFSSYAATVVLAETIIGMLVVRADAGAQKRIAEVEHQNRRLEEVWDT